MSRRELWITATAGTLMVALMLGGAAYFLASFNFDTYDNRDGPRIAQAIRDAQSPIVVEVSYRAGDFADPASISVRLKTGRSAAEMSTFVTNVIPAACRVGTAPESMGIFLLDQATGASAGDHMCP